MSSLDNLPVIRDQRRFIAAEAARLEAMSQAQAAATDEARYEAAAFATTLAQRQMRLMQERIKPDIDAWADDEDAKPATDWVAAWCRATAHALTEWNGYMDDLAERLPPGRAAQLRAIATDRGELVAPDDPSRTPHEPEIDPAIPSGEPESDENPVQTGPEVGAAPEQSASPCIGYWAVLTDELANAVLAVCVERVAPTGPSSGYADEVPRGSVVVAVTAAARNIGDRWFVGDLSLWARVLDSKHRQYEAEQVDVGEPHLGDMHLAPGDERRGLITFVVPRDVVLTECQVAFGPSGAFFDCDLTTHIGDAQAPRAAQPHAPALLGESIALDARDGRRAIVILHEVLDPVEPADEYDRPEQGRRLLGVRLTIENAGSVALELDVDLSTSMIDERRAGWDPAIEDIALPQLRGLRLGAGKRRDGYVGFTLPEGVLPTQVQFRLPDADRAAEWTLHG